MAADVFARDNHVPSAFAVSHARIVPGPYLSTFSRFTSLEPSWREKPHARRAFCAPTQKRGPPNTLSSQVFTVAGLLVVFGLNAQRV